MTIRSNKEVLISKLENRLKELPSLFLLWDKVSSQYVSFVHGKPHSLIINRILVEGESQCDVSLSNGFNDLKNIDEIKPLDIFYIIKLCLTGKNNLSHEVKSKIKRISLQINIDNKIFTSRVELGSKIRGILYQASIEELLSQKPLDDLVVTEGKNNKEVQNSLKAFFGKVLELPFLKNTAFHNNRLINHSITFATYYSLFFLDSQRPYKIFNEDQSTFWRKRAIQIILGLRGIPLISLFQTLLAENKFDYYKLMSFKNELTKKIYSLQERVEWEKRYYHLTQRKRELIDLKHTFSESLEDLYHLDTERKIDIQIKEVYSKLHHRQTQEVRILHDIHHLGGDFQPKKRHKKSHHNGSDEQFLFKPDIKIPNSHKDKIENLIADYYSNLSQTEILDDELKELEQQKKRELEKTLSKEQKSNKGIGKEIDLLDKEIDRLIVNELSQNKTTSPILKEVLKNIYIDEEFFKRDFNSEQKCLFDCIEIVKEHFIDIHKKQLITFFNVMRENLKHFNSEGTRGRHSAKDRTSESRAEIDSIRFTKHYIPKITYHNKDELTFNQLSDEQKRDFIVGFHISLLQISFTDGGAIPLVMFISFFDEISADCYVEKIKELFSSSQKSFQIIFA